MPSRFFKQPRGIRWLIGFLVVGFVLGLLLVVENLSSFRYVSTHLIPDHLEALAGRHVSQVEDAALRLNPSDGAALARILEDVLSEHTGDIAWIRVADQDGRVLAVAGPAPGAGVAAAILEELFDNRTQRVSRTAATPSGDVRRVFLPFRFRFPEERAVAPGTQGERPRPRFKVAEVALYLHGPSDPFFPLVRSLVTSLAAGVALVACILLIGISLGGYVRGQKVMQQLALARAVQQAFLPSEGPRCEGLEAAVEYVPNSEVSGDYYTLYPHREGHLTAVLGDVSGKGLPAALVVGLLHGAIRFASSFGGGKQHRELAAELNRLLHSCTSTERFATLFWARYEIATRQLSYVNCGHPPALILRSGLETLDRLGIGGPVLGLFPALLYHHEVITMGPGDLLVVCSDGVLEAANGDEVEFGEERLLEVLKSHRQDPAGAIGAAVVKAVQDFTGRETFDDDLTLMILRF